jgi:hypothetical protein
MLIIFSEVQRFDFFLQERIFLHILPTNLYLNLLLKCKEGGISQRLDTYLPHTIWTNYVLGSPARPTNSDFAKSANKLEYL